MNTELFNIESRMNELPNELINYIFNYHNPYKSQYDNAIVEMKNIQKKIRQYKAQHTLYMFELDFHISETWYYTCPRHKAILHDIKAHKELDLYDSETPLTQWIFDYGDSVCEFYESDEAYEKFQMFLEDLDYKNLDVFTQYRIGA